MIDIAKNSTSILVSKNSYIIDIVVYQFCTQHKPRILIKQYTRTHGNTHIIIIQKHPKKCSMFRDFG